MVQPLLMAGLFLLTEAPNWTREDQRDFSPFWLAASGLIGTQSLWELTWGVDLTPESVNLRGFRRGRIAWREVQAVLRYERAGSRTVRLIPENGKPVTLRAPRNL